MKKQEIWFSFSFINSDKTIDGWATAKKKKNIKNFVKVNREKHNEIFINGKLV
jgi:hypothetical protein